MGIFNSLMQRSMSKEASRLAQEVKALYAESKARNPSAIEPKIIRGMYFDENALAKIPETSRKRIMACCETVQGFCYMMALDVGKFKKMINLRSLQFTRYMDDALNAQNFPPQSKEQKARILDAMELKIENWDRISGD